MGTDLEYTQRPHLEDSASFPLGATASLNERRTGSVLKHLTNALASLGGALEITDSTNLLRNSHTLLGGNGALTGLAKLLDNLGVVTQILLASNQDDGKVLAEVEHLGDPLLLDVVERVGRVDGEADEDNVRVGVRERTESVVVFLTGGIPKGELYMTAIHLDIGNVVLENGGDVDLGESTLLKRRRAVESRCKVRAVGRILEGYECTREVRVSRTNPVIKLRNHIVRAAAI